MAQRIEIQYKKDIKDTRANVRFNKIKQDYKVVEKVFIADVYTISKDFSDDSLHQIADSLTNPVIQNFKVNDSIMDADFDYAIEIGCLPGVTDNTGKAAREIIIDMLKVNFEEQEDVYYSQVTYIKGELSQEQVEMIGKSLANELIQRIHIKFKTQYDSDNGMDVIVPKVNLHEEIKIDEVNLDISDEELIILGKQGIANQDGTRRGPLALDLKSLLAIKEYFKKEGRKPTDAELEALAQTWSEHCKHTIFASKIDEIEDGLYSVIKKATNEIRAAKEENDFCVSVFKDNSGAIIFDDEYLVTDKVETHNSPSALDPFGGAITGIVGVNRDTIGFGKAAMPFINKYGYCFADPFDKEPLFKDENLETKMLSPRRILDGVIEGVNAGGNCSGIPTPQGFMYFNDRYKGKPLVFVGTLGVIPREVNGQPSWEKKAMPGDAIIMIGGKVGVDGIHGATFSSESLSSGSPATAVQIGDPYTQKKLSDAITKEARELGLYSSITDNGAGGLSSSIGEMAEEAGGCKVWLDKVPLKYPGMQPWQIWISESQERMSLAVPKNKLDEFMKLMERRGVGAWVIGEFNNSGRCVVKYEDKSVLDLDMQFMHDGNPKYELSSDWQKPEVKQPELPVLDQTQTLLDMAASLNNTSFDFISYQYDYEVLGGSCIKPLQGKGQVNSTASVTRPILSSKKGVVCSQALYPTYSELDSYNMAACSIDTAIRNAVAVGGDVDYMSLLDNFCWCSSTEEDRLGQLKEAVKACYDTATAFGTPFISGKDSMFNDFKGFDKNGQAVKISVPPTLLISTTGIIDDTDKCITLDAKHAGDLVYVIGQTKNELGGSEYLAHLQIQGGKVPEVDMAAALNRYRTFKKAVDQELISSAYSINISGLSMGLVKTSIGGMLGMDIDLSKLKKANDVDRDDVALYSETQSRFIVTISPDKKAEFENIFADDSLSLIGQVIETDFKVRGISGEQIISTDVVSLNEYYRKTFKGF